MRYKLMLILLLNAAVCNSQSLVNGDFMLGNNTNNASLNGTCHYFDNNWVQNWKRTHGSPNLTGTGNDVFLWWGGIGPMRGEGIVAGYTFIPGRTYKIKVWIAAGNVVASDGRLEIHTVTPLSHSILPTTAPSCGGSVPLAAWDGDWIGQITSSSPNVYEFCYTPSSLYAGISLFPFSQTNARVDFVIDKVSVERVCRPSISYQSGTHPHGNINYYQYIFIGGPNMVNNDPNQDTWIEAADFIDFSASSNTTVSSGKVLQAEIKPCAAVCTPHTGNYYKEMPPPAVPIEEDYEHEEYNLPEMEWETDGEDEEPSGRSSGTSIQTSPNPFVEKLTFSISSSHEVDAVVRLIDVTGRVVFSGTTKFRARSLDNVSIDTRTLPIGLYYLEAQVGGEKIIKRVLKQTQ